LWWTSLFLKVAGPLVSLTPAAEEVPPLVKEAEPLWSILEFLRRNPGPGLPIPWFRLWWSLTLMTWRFQPSFLIAPLATPGPANAEAADGHLLGIPYVEGHQRPVGIYFRAGPVGVDPFEGIPTIGNDRPRELVGAVLGGESRGGRAVRSHPGKILAGGEDRVASRGSGGNGYPYADRYRNC